MRGRLRQQGVALRAAKDAAQQAAGEVERAAREHDERVAEMQAQLQREREHASAERVRAERAVADAHAARQSAWEARRADEVRLGLLMDTVEGAAAGLRRELALGPSGAEPGALPADTVRGAGSAPAAGVRVTDEAALDRVLALPEVHLIVDGYNVTKTAYPELALADQRARLIGQLAALAARTGAEVTLVFDGADVLAAPPVTARGIRVLFSDPGVLADDVIRNLVTAEPSGRPALVATSDRALAESVRGHGAHQVVAALLVRRLHRV